MMRAAGMATPNETEHLEVPGPLIGDPQRLRTDLAKLRVLVCRGFGQHLRVDSTNSGTVPAATLISPERQFAAGGDGGMRGEDLLDQRGTRPGHADDE